MSISLMVSFWASSPLSFCFCVTVLFYRYLHFVVNQIKLQSYKVTFIQQLKIIRRCMEKYSLLTKLAKCTLNIALKLTFSVFLLFFVFWLHFRPPRSCLMPFFERQFFTEMTVERREEKVGKPFLTGSALSGDKFCNICDMETIPPETDVLINNAHFPSFTSPKFPFRRS